jgi:hypothetical protein
VLINNSMGLPITTTYSLSALSPVKFTYKFNKEEKLSSTLNLFSNGFGYYNHEAFKNFHDAALSKKNCLILTNNKPLKDVFESDSKQIDIGTVAGCIFLKTSTGKYFTTYLNGLYIGGIGQRSFINVVPISNNTVELKTSKTQFIQIDKEYPYTAKVSEEILDGDDLVRQRFELDYKDGLVSLKTLTQEGYRYLSYGVDQTVRAVGLMLNETVVNSYLFIPEFVTENGLHHDFDAKTSEVKYFNELTAFANRYNLNIKDEQESDTNLLISCTTADIALSASVAANIALTKTNFSSTGSYSTKRST